MSTFANASARRSLLASTTRAKTGGKGIRTPDFQLAKLALYQLSYAPCELSSLDCGAPIANVRERAFSHELFWRLFLQEQGAYQPAAFAVRKKPKPDVDLINRHPAFVRFFERANLCSCAGKAALLALIAQKQVPPNTLFSHR